MASMIGAGAHGRDLEVVWYRCGRSPLGLYDDDPSTGIPAPPDNLSGRILIGINSPTTRRQIAERFAHLQGTHPLVDPSAVVGPNVELGRGVVVAPLAVLMHSVSLGAHVHANYSVSMTRCLVGAYTTVSPGATICGDVEIGEECLIGAGAIICDRSIIGHHVRIGAGAILPPLSRVPDYTTVIGVWKG